ncbi:hypothetical protein GCM10011490_22910 [Pseudoclavibacter endophyticus]|uniref:Amidohydrolase family protein n=1 Tax=Pseudoclavibacter endophyticus TaxID=1778590 RepID=A0A6H9WNH2_9MICO|nr:DUF6282 family protein [Pseudoclavibacter endophyticus]KAB1648318.1 hypothetical protein F8O04_11505 [Pseudoclavibacter endophyticus]GGA71615.1 hypothetical protein GCM10011490_22910 [Pseudoclavibacter endophyticus]
MEASPAVTKLLDGLVDMHCHSGPAPFPREFDHVEAAREGDRINMRAFVSKSHHHSTVMDMKAAYRSFEGIGTKAFGGVALNNQVGGLNPYAVEMCVRMGGKVVWFPTFSSRRHIEYHEQAVSQGFPQSAVQLTTVPVLVHDDSGALRPEVAQIADIVEESGAVFNGGHLHADDMFEVFSVGADRGVQRMVASHPNFITDLTPQQGKELADLGVYLEHEVGMYLPNEQPFFEIDTLMEWLEVVGIERSYFASDLGQIGRTHPVDAFIYVATALLDRGVPEKDLRRMFVDTPTYLIGFDEAA